jgi:hypothetical protein
LDADILEEYAAVIFAIEVCRFNNRLSYIGKLQGHVTQGALVKKRGT